MRYKKELEKYVYETKFITFYNKIPVIVYYCNLKLAYKQSKFFKKMKWNSPCFVHVCFGLFNKIKEYAIFIAYDEEFKKISPKAQKLLLYHEIGHIMKQTDDGLSNEDEADKYAIKFVGKVFKADVEKMAKWISNYGKRYYENTYIDFMNRFT